MIIVDSCGWLEHFVDGPLKNEYKKYLSNLDQVVTPSVVLTEVFRKLI